MSKVQSIKTWCKFITAGHPVYPCMKESSGCIAPARKETYALKSRRIRSATFGHDSLTSVATTATADQSAHRRMTHPRLGPHVNSLVPFSSQSPANCGMICISRWQDQAVPKIRSRISSYWLAYSLYIYNVRAFCFRILCQMVRWYTVTERSVSGINFKHENQKGRTLPCAPIGTVRESRVLG